MLPRLSPLPPMLPLQAEPEHDPEMDPDTEPPSMLELATVEAECT